MSVEWADLLLTACGLLSGGCLKLWSDLQASRRRAKEEQRQAIRDAEERAYERARNEALTREAQAAVIAKNVELQASRELNMRLQERYDELASAYRRLSEERSA